ncbi:MAG TPA: hypothetical protein VF922_08225 [Bradyrhizobium sp.]
MGRAEAPGRSQQARLDFRHLDETFIDDALVRPTHSRRWRAIGMNVHSVVAVIFVALGLEAISVIGMRPASKQERKLYAEHQEGL